MKKRNRRKGDTYNYYYKPVTWVDKYMSLPFALLAVLVWVVALAMFS
jgi:hypothetical protein